MADISLSIDIGSAVSVLVAIEIGVLIDTGLLTGMDTGLTWTGLLGSSSTESMRDTLDSSKLISVFISSFIRFSDSAEESLLRLLEYLCDHFLFGDCEIAQVGSGGHHCSHYHSPMFFFKNNPNVDHGIKNILIARIIECS